jgi:putative ABC transport system permease protein
MSHRQSWSADDPPTPVSDRLVADEPPEPVVTRPSMGARDLFEEALAGIAARPLRSALTVLGTVLGITTLVITLGIAATAGNQIAGRFDAASATEVTVVVPGRPDPSQPPTVSWDALRNLVRLNGVSAAAAIANPDTAQAAQVRTNDLEDPTAVTDRTLPAVAATQDLSNVLDAPIARGRFFDAGHVARHDRVAVLGAEAAKLLGVTRIDDEPTVFVNDKPFTVIGLLGPSAATSSRA